MKLSLENLRQHFPDQFEQKLGNVKILPTKNASVEAYYQHWLMQHKNDFIEIESWDDTCDNVPPGKVLIKAALSGDAEKAVAYWMVDYKFYKEERTEFGYIINKEDEPRKLT